tara:strand:- start:116 stop:547 length:432 start_codon:yes stop_codon:yes gene_type:complete
MTIKSLGFSLIELLVVIAIIGILSAVGTVTYSSYSNSAKATSAKNIMQQIGLGQIEYLSGYGTYYYNSETGDCNVSIDQGNGATSNAIEANLFNGGDIITSETRFDMCIQKVDGNNGTFLIKATNGSSEITLDHTGAWGDSFD